jgi:hypothetical protein
MGSCLLLGTLYHYENLRGREEPDFILLFHENPLLTILNAKLGGVESFYCIGDERTSHSTIILTNLSSPFF